MGWSHRFSASANAAHWRNPAQNLCPKLTASTAQLQLHQSSPPACTASRPLGRCPGTTYAQLLAWVASFSGLHPAHARASLDCSLTPNANRLLGPLSSTCVLNTSALDKLEVACPPFAFSPLTRALAGLGIDLVPDHVALRDCVPCLDALTDCDACLACLICSLSGETDAGLLCPPRRD